MMEKLASRRAAGWDVAGIELKWVRMREGSSAA